MSKNETMSKFQTELLAQLKEEGRLMKEQDKLMKELIELSKANIESNQVNTEISSAARSNPSHQISNPGDRDMVVDDGRMTKEEAITIIKKEFSKYSDTLSVYAKKRKKAFDMAIKALRYQPIILQEHDAEPRRLRAILDTATEEIYVCKLTKQGADILGITIEEIEE